MKKEAQKEEEKEQKKVSPLEKVIFFVGLLILIGLLGYLIFQSANDQNAPAQLEIEVQPVVSEHCAFEVLVQNKGGTTAEGVNIGFDLYRSGKTVADATATIDFVPIASQKTLHVVFQRKKASCDSLVVSFVSYKEP